MSDDQFGFKEGDSLLVKDAFLVLDAGDIAAVGEAGAAKRAIKEKYGFEVTDEYARDFIAFVYGMMARV